jgi:G3E family GTPase
LRDDDIITPVWVLTGFLGSGKTTLLSRLMRHREMRDTAVIVNEWGEVGLDHRLVAESAENNVLLLDSGCLCCAMGDDLAETMTDLFHKRARGEIPHFDRLVIETTGLADPGPIIGTLLGDRVMTSRYRLAAVLTVIDGLLGLKQFEQHKEPARQAALADRIIIAKRDLISDADEAALIARLRAENPRAEIISAIRGDVSPGRLLAFASEQPGGPDHHAEGRTHDHEHGHDTEHRHSDGVETVFVPFPRVLRWSEYAALVTHLQRRFGAALWRTKGLIRLEDEPTPMAVQGVQVLFAPPAAVENAEEARLGLVLIGEGLGDAAGLMTELAPYGAATN